MRQNPNIYRIDQNHRLLKSLNQPELVIEKIINTHFRKFGYNTIFKPESLKKTTKDNIIYFLYLYNSNEIVSDWEEFLPKNLTINANFNQQKLSLVLFIKTEHEIFSIIGGNAYQIILPFIDHSFGLNTYARIMKPESDELASIKSRGITGLRAGINEQFRENYKIIDFIKFGKIPQEIHLRLSQEITDLHFGFLKSKAHDRIQVFVSKAFKIKKGVDFDELHKTILELCIISQLVPSDYLSSYKEITNKAYIEDFLKPELITKILNDTEYLNKPESPSRFEHDFSNPNNIEKFYEADEYKIKEKTDKGGYSVFEIVTDRKDIYHAVLSRAVERFGVTDRFKFMVFLQGVRITCHQNKKATLASSFLYHISAEFQIQGKPVFLVDTKWYHLRDSFVRDLKVNTLHILRTYAAPKHILDLVWDKKIVKTEKKYNKAYNQKANYIVIDTIIADGLELCDILHYDNNNLYLIHVKYGFGSNMRELTNQVTISARRLREALGTEERKILEKIYERLVEKKHNIDNLSLEEFKNLFNKKITYILAFTSHLNEDYKVENNIERFNSNIAKFSLIQCSSEMRAYYYDMLTYQIERE